MPSGSLYSVYIGGGTPTVLSTGHFERIFTALFERFHLSASAEVTVEANPESVNRGVLRVLRRGGVNRISIGLQSIYDRHLRFLGRVHSFERFREAYTLVRSEGFDNVNIDLMFGIPDMTRAEWERTLNTVVRLRPEHLSVYGLSREKGTCFDRDGVVIDEDVSAEQYEQALVCLRNEGYRRYEISNFALAGRESRHNLVYWNGGQYYGAGAGAAGYIGGRRWKNDPRIEGYINAVEQGGTAAIEEEFIDRSRKSCEKLFLGLRKEEGVRCGPGETAVVRERLGDPLHDGLLVFEPPVLRLTDRGMLLANRVWRALL